MVPVSAEWETLQSLTNMSVDFNEYLSVDDDLTTGLNEDLTTGLNDETRDPEVALMPDQHESSDESDIEEVIPPTSKEIQDDARDLSGMSQTTIPLVCKQVALVRGWIEKYSA
ncbi:unnamed protein product [Parnassius apollo]|uniref:(apollo) hypothetical protein n=1 Tax=Parnassius apollo TaxID=110799 RepID=A0A8S3XEI2_PARAO|nr:unnamed protein product [Parnassius apollo]